MAMYDIKYSCGHTGRVNITGTNRNGERDWRRKTLEEGLCPECYEIDLKARRAAALEDAIEKSKDYELPGLTGTEKQIAWATKIRIKRLEEFQQLNPIGAGLKAFDYLMSITDAHFWIDTREKIARVMIIEAVENFEKKADEAQYSESKPELQIIAPKNPRMDAPAEVKYDSDKVTVISKKDEGIIKLLKSHGFKWDGSAWSMAISERMVSAADRAAEIGNKLLNDGVPLQISDEIKDITINATYTPTADRWIGKIKDRDVFSVWWVGRDDRVYKVARSLPGARYESPSVIVPQNAYVEVQEFARLFDFKFSRAALALIETQKQKIAASETVNPFEKTVEYKDGLQEILNTKGILEDLKEN